MTPFDEYLHAVLTEGAGAAQRDGSVTVEAQHLLLAIAGLTGTAPQRALAAAGLDQQAIHEALRKEFEHSLAAVGVPAGNAAPPTPRSYRTEQPKVGASTRLALERGFNSVPRKRDLRPAHVLLGILAAEVGIVPRALALAGVDRAALRTQVEQLLEDA